MRFFDLVIIVLTVSFLIVLVRRIIKQLWERQRSYFIPNMDECPLVHGEAITPIDPDSATIFVSVASYRDKQCSKTIQDLYEKAAYPNRIFVGIVQQNFDTDAECITEDNNHIRILRMKAADAQGPCLARYHATKLYRGETFFLQIDSHTRFIDKWDQLLINIYMGYQRLINTDKIVISHYPLSFDVHSNNLPANYQNLTTSYHKIFQNTDGIMQFEAAIINSFDPTTVCKRQPIAAAGFMFGLGRMLRDVPFDPDLPFLFHGEELLYSIRLFAQKYIILTPSRAIAFHYYERATEPKVWSDNQKFYQENQKILQRVRKALLLEEGYDPHILTYTPATSDVKAYYQFFALIPAKN